MSASSPGGRLISVGNVVVDLLASVPALPERGGDVVATDSRLEAGGSFSVLVAAARQGMSAAYGGAHGTGPFGDLVRSALAANGIDVLLEPVAGTDTGYDVAITDAGGERTFVTVVGAEAALTSARLRRLEARPGDTIQVSGYGLLREPNREAIVSWLEKLPASVTVLVDPGPLVVDIRPDVLRRVRDRADWFSCNRRESERLTGRSDPDAACLALAAEAPGRAIIVRLGPDGCLLAMASSAPIHVAGFAVEAVDTNGAGDAHTGIFLAALAAGADPVAAARRANAGAALAVTRSGPGAAPTREELDRFLAETPDGGRDR